MARIQARIRTGSSAAGMDTCEAGSRLRAAADFRRCAPMRAGGPEHGARTRDHIRAPFGGYKRSGIGRELGPFGLDEFLEIKAVLT